MSHADQRDDYLRMANAYHAMVSGKRNSTESPAETFENFA
jgi:hypothetical protein